MISYKDDADLAKYEPNAKLLKQFFLPKNRIGLNVIGIDRQTGLIVIASKRNLQGGLLETPQLAMFLSGVDEAVITDGGASVGCYVKNKFTVLSGRQEAADRPDAKNTVTNYLVFRLKP